MFSLRLKLLVWLFIAVMFFSISSGADYTQVQDYIERGELSKAQHALRALSGSDHLEQETAYYQGLIQPDGDISIVDLKKALLLCSDNCEDILSQLSSAYFCQGEYQKVVSLYKDHDNKLDNKSRAFPVYWFTALSYMRLGDNKNAEKIIKKTSKSSDIQSLWGELLRANLQYLNDKKKSSRSRQNDVISSGGSPAQAALYNRTYFYAQDKNMDRALSGFTMLKDQRDGFLGSDDLLRLMDGGSGFSSDGSAERITGVRYTIQIGTFAEREEGAKIARDLKKDGWTIFENSKFIDGKKYWIISVGAFQTVEKAQRTKKILENKLSASLQVVILE